MAVVTLENTTVNDELIRASGQFVAAGSTITVQPKLYASYTEGVGGNDQDLIDKITNGDFVIRVDGVPFADAANAIRFLSTFDFTLVAKEGSVVSAANTVINFTGNVTVTETAPGVLEVGVGEKDDDDFKDTIFNVDFSGSNDEWQKLGSEDNNSNETPYVFPFNCKLVAIGYSNKNSGTRFNLDLYKALADAGSNRSRVLRWSRTSNTRVATIRTGAETDATNLDDITFAIGDKLSVFLDQNGGTGGDNHDIRLYFKITSSPLTDSNENYGGGDDDDDDDD